jgi:hypothetical protein
MTVAPAPVRDTLAELEECVTVLDQELRQLRGQVDNRTAAGARVQGELSIALIALGAAQLRIRRAYQQAAGL